MVGQALRVVDGRRSGVVGLALAERHEQGLVVAEHQPRAIVVVADDDLRQLPEDHLHAVERVAVEQAARHRRARADGAVFGIAPVDPRRGGEIGIDRHVEQAALARLRAPRGTPVSGVRQRGAVGADDAHAPGPLGDQHAAVGQEGQPPGVFEAGGERHRARRASRHRWVAWAPPATAGAWGHRRRHRRLSSTAAARPAIARRRATLFDAMRNAGMKAFDPAAVQA